MHVGGAVLLEDQAGVVARRQLLEVGLTHVDVARLLRRRELRAIHPGVYVNHTGEPSWSQLAWAAVLYCWPAALAGQSALRAFEGRGSRRRTIPVEVVVAIGRKVRAPRAIK